MEMNRKQKILLSRLCCCIAVGEDLCLRISGSRTIGRHDENASVTTESVLGGRQR
jgi:hypothetical protein